MQKSVFWSAIKADAKKFEGEMSALANKFTNPPCKWLSQPGENTSDYTAHTQLYLKRTAMKKKSKKDAEAVTDDLVAVIDGKIIIGDDVHIKVDFDGETKFNRGKYHDSKLSDSAPWTDNQKSELIELFKNDPDLEYIEFEIRTDPGKLSDQNSPYLTGQKVRIYRNDIYKSFKKTGRVQTFKEFK